MPQEIVVGGGGQHGNAEVPEADQIIHVPVLEIATHRLGHVVCTSTWDLTSNLITCPVFLTEP
jgi:hypothetical protein